MTVSELIATLQQFDGDMEVKTSVQSGDYWGTVLANDIHNVDIANVTNSDYHRTYKVIEDEKIDNYDESEIQQVVLI